MIQIGKTKVGRLFVGAANGVATSVGRLFVGIGGKAVLVWEAVASCCSSGVWRPDKPWRHGIPWRSARTFNRK